VGFEPTNPYGQGISSPVLYFDRDKEEWYEWAKRETPSSANKYKSKLEIYLRGLKIYTPKDLRKAILGIDPDDRHAFLAIRNYIRFLEKTGKIRKSEAEDLRAVVPNIKTEARSEAEKAISVEDIIKAYKSIKGEGINKKARQIFFKLLLFTGLREVEVIALINNFSLEILNRTIKAFNLENYTNKLVVYDLETIKIPTRKYATKRGYIAIFPKELVPEIQEIRNAGVEVKYSLIRKDRMFKDPNVIDLTLLRKFHYNWFNDNALKVPNMPADVYRIIEFMQGRTHKEVGGRSYRANVQTAVRLYYWLVDEYKRVLKDIIFI